MKISVEGHARGGREVVGFRRKGEGQRQFEGKNQIMPAARGGLGCERWEEEGCG